MTTTTFSYTSAQQTWVVPAGVTSVAADLRGANASYPSAADGGARCQTTLTVTPAETLNIYVGGGSGYNGGGLSYYGSPSGAGASDIRRGGTTYSDRIAVAGGSGGVGYSGTDNGGGGGVGGYGGAAGVAVSGNGLGGGNGTAGGGAGGTGGGAVSASALPNANGNGTVGLINPYNSYGYGGGGAGGGGGSPGGGAAVSSGLSPTSASNNGGGGGGGGGGGSASTGTSTTFTQGYNSGQGSIIFTYTAVVPFSQALLIL